MASFTEKEQEQIRLAIEAAEKNTSGEIRICAEKNCKGEAIERALTYFTKVGMDKTALKNGVLIYIATEDHKFAIIGDSGINNVVPDNFWNTTKDAMLEKFREGRLADGIVTGITMAGEKLREYFPYIDGDKNELPDEISFID